jgi:hypothetical protein
MTTGMGGVNTTVSVSGGGERLRSVWYPKGKAIFKKGKANDEGTGEARFSWLGWHCGGVCFCLIELARLGWKGGFLILFLDRFISLIITSE